MRAGAVVVLNGVPGSGRSSIAAAGGWVTVDGWEAAAVEARAGYRVAVEAALSERADAHAAARRLAGLDVLFVGVRCPLAVLLERLGVRDRPAPPDVARLHAEVHRWRYDLEVDTSVLSPKECAREVARALVDPPVPSAFARLATVVA